VANGFYWREKHEVEMWTAWNDVITAPQIWDTLREHAPGAGSAVWFPLLAKGAGADLVCTPAPIHNPDGSESLWCYTKPTEMYGQLRDELGHFPLMHFWGPLANIKSTDWICRSAVVAARNHRPNFFYIYLPHLDYAAQRSGPDSPAALQALVDLDQSIGQLIEGVNASLAPASPLWLVASEYTITPVSHVLYPNRLLREAGLLSVKDGDGGEVIDFAGSGAWALADHQFSHVFAADAATAETAAATLRGRQGVAEVLVGAERAKYDLDHPRAGEVVVVSSPESWQAYYYWLDDARAPKFARTVDIHRKPGYDPVELHFDPATRSIPLDAGLVRGSHGAPALDERQRGVLLASQRGALVGQAMSDTDVHALVLKQFGI
jgi:predicted AlkP superfamily pyrophosphatase or phosphodiesterase